MNSVTVDELIMRIEIELDRFRAQAGEAENIEKRLRGALKNTEEAGKKAGEQFGELGDSVGESNKALRSNLKAVTDVAGRLVRLFGIITGSNAIQSLANGVAKANDQLNFLSQRLNMAGRDIRSIDTAVAALGGSGASAINTIRNLNQGIQEMVLMGNDALIPFFGALGVGVVDAAGNIREMDDILLDMADSFERMDPAQAYALAQAMGLDDGVANALVQGRDAMQEMLDLHQSIYVSTQEEVAASRELARAQALLSAQWGGLTTIIGNALIPGLLRMTEIVSGWMDYLNRNERTVRNFFEGIAIAVGVVLLPVLAKATMGMLALLSPVLGTAAAVVALGGAFALLYDDYKTWADGGESLFDWGAFKKYIDESEFSVNNLSGSLAFLLTGYESFEEAQEAFMGWMRERGIIDQHGFSIRGLADAFRELAREVVSAIPGLSTALELLGAAMEGDWSRVLQLSKQVASEVALGLTHGFLNISERSYGAIDMAFGHDPSQPGTLAGGVRAFRSFLFDDDSEKSLDDQLAEHEERLGLPRGIGRAIYMQETGGSQEYLDNPEKYHYDLDESGRRIAPHTGQVSTAFGPFGILESTARDPGYGVTPLRNKSLEEQVRFFMEYLAARIRSAGSVEEGLAGYGEGEVYSQQVMGRIDAAGQARGMSRNMSVNTENTTRNVSNNVEVHVGSVSVQTSAATLPAATAEGVAAGVSRGGDLLNQLGGGLQ